MMVRSKTLGLSTINNLDEAGEIKMAVKKGSTMSRLKKWLSESSIFIFHKDMKIRKLCLKLCEPPESITEQELKRKNSQLHQEK